MSRTDAVSAVRAYARSGRGRRQRSWSDRYLALFAAALLAVLAVRPIWWAAARLPAAEGRSDPSQSAVGLMLVVLTFTAVLAVGRTFGPIVVSPPDAQWLVLSPLDRRAVLRPAAARLLLVSIVAGGVLGVSALILLGVPGDVPLRLLAAVVLGASLMIAGMSATVLSQHSDNDGVWLTTVLAAVAILAALITVAARSERLPGLRLIGSLAQAPAAAGVGAAGVAAMIAAVLARSAWRSLACFPARAVLDASVRLGHTANMTLGLEPALVFLVAEDDYWRRRRLRSRRWPRLPASAALAWQDWRTLGRRPKRLMLLTLSAIIPTLAVPQGARMSLLLPGILLIGALAAAASGTTGARRESGDITLQRIMALAPASVLMARTVLPTILAALWLTVALTGLMLVGTMPTGSWLAAGPAAAPALGAAALRMAGRGSIDHGLPPIDTPMGPIPSGPLLWALTGLDVAFIGCAPLTWAMLTGHTAVLPAIAVQAMTALATLAIYIMLNARKRRRRGESVPA